MDSPAAIGRWLGIVFIGILFFIFSAACAAKHGPVLYPNEHLIRVGDAQAQQDIAECNGLAEAYAKPDPGAEVAKSAVGGAVAGAIIGGAMGAVTGNLGRGAAIGAAGGGAGGVIHGAVRGSQPTPVYMNFVDRCLRERGYEPIGWQ
jgi:outer membrane lipoprotein SlyB